MGDNSLKIERISLMQIISAVIIALIPILFSYKQIFSISPTYITLILLMPYVCLKLLKKTHIVLKHMGVLSLYLFYIVINHGITFGDIVVLFIFLLYALAVNNNLFNTICIWKSIIVISCFATCCVLIQAFFFYGMGIQIHMCPTNLMEPSVWEQYGVDSSYSAGGGTLFRPAAFFLEPSIYSQYVVLPLMFLRLSEYKGIKRNKWIAIFLSIGIVCSTSGIGIATTLIIWILSYGKDIFGNKNILKGVIGILFLAILLLILFSFIEPFKESVLRIFGLGNSSDKGALAGRTGGIVFVWDALSRSQTQLLFGTGEYIVRWYTWGFLGSFFRTIYEHGLIGVSLFTLLFLQPGIFLKSWQKWIALYIIALSLVSGVTLQSMIFYYILIYSKTDKHYTQQVSSMDYLLNDTNSHKQNDKPCFRNDDVRGTAF